MANTMISAIPPAGTLQALKSEAQRQLLSIKRGNAFSLLANGQDDDEAAAAITGEEREAFPNVIGFLEHEMMPCRLNDNNGTTPTPIFDAVGAYVALTSLGAPAEQRAELSQSQLAFWPSTPNNWYWRLARLRVEHTFALTSLSRSLSSKSRERPIE